ncbi:hypothetical protein [Kineosporia babensis]|uniref:Uncharacterized protein n=1 Tax=Kineosporia babensis TaxID=499548 RepID=A0A9X1SUI0_9ACTN|nr:hypothetical protein [Kineosporia babensis]MCD5313002.1 hypothetical protein [Kineosporia babensis]
MQNDELETAGQEPLKQLIARLAAGEVTLDEIAEDFRRRTFPSRPRVVDGEDAEADPEGSFMEVAVAFSMGQIDAHTYDVLARAAVQGEERRQTGVSASPAGPALT